MAVFEMRNARKAFGALEVLKGVSLKVEKGEVVSIIGPSGGGKSTMLRCATLLETMDGGDLKYMGQYAVRDENGRAVYAPAAELKKLKSCFGLVFQNFNLFPHYSVLRNITEAPMLIQKRPKDEVQKEAEALLDRVGLLAKKNSYPRELSGGELQRAALARVTVLEPEMILLDEPTSMLDVITQAQMIDFLRRYQQHHQTAYLFITHSTALAEQFCDEIVKMEDGHLLKERNTK